jgi:hypothetical protein
MKKTLLLILILLLGLSFLKSQEEIRVDKKRPVLFKPRLSTDSELGHFPCPDTIKVLFFKKVVDMDLMLPTWQPVEDYNTVTVLEGTVIPKPGNNKHIDTHVSPEDLPLFHYTHDFSFNVRPDSTDDSRYTNLLSLQVAENGKDTALREYIHVEWETGLAMANKGNPCAEANKTGKSCGFYTEGHERKDLIWNWPTIGDWVHVEGLWVWDRGHPPAGTEIHPARLVAIRRNLPEFIEKDKESKSPGEKAFATRIDIFANGNGGALVNNLQNVPEFVRRIKMGEKDYEFSVRHTLPAPKSTAPLRYKIIKQKGDNFTGDIHVTAYPYGDEDIDEVHLKIKIDWKGLPDTLVFARTIFTYWDEGNGVADAYPVNTYKVKLESLRFRNRKEFFSKSEFRVFMEVGGKWLFFNEFIDVDDILNNGIGHTRKRKWEINKEFILYAAEVPCACRRLGGRWTRSCFWRFS